MRDDREKGEDKGWGDDENEAKLMMGLECAKCMACVWLFDIFQDKFIVFWEKVRKKLTSTACSPTKKVSKKFESISAFTHVTNRKNKENNKNNKQIYRENSYSFPIFRIPNEMEIEFGWIKWKEGSGKREGWIERKKQATSKKVLHAIRSDGNKMPKTFTKKCSLLVLFFSRLVYCFIFKPTEIHTLSSVCYAKVFNLVKVAFQPDANDGYWKESLKTFHFLVPEFPVRGKVHLNKMHSWVNCFFS